MKKKTQHKIIVTGIILIVIQSFLQQYDTFKEIFNQYLSYLMPMIYGFFITILLEPLVSFFEKKFKLNRIVSAIITMFIILGIAIFFLLLTIPQIGRTLKELYLKLPLMQNELERYITTSLNFLREKELLVVDEFEIENNIIKFFRENMKYIQNIGFSAFRNIIWWIAGVTKILIGFFLAFLILINKEYFIRFYRNIITLIFGKDKKDEVMLFLDKGRDILLNYIWGRTIVSTVVGVIVFLVLVFSKTPYALLSGLLIGIGNMIPIVGSFVAGGISIFLIALATPEKLLFIIVAIALAQFVDSWIIGPKIVSEVVGMSIFWVVVSVLIGGSLFGALGMFFGVPLFGVIKIIYEEILERKKIDE